MRALWTGRHEGDARLVGPGPAPPPVPAALAVAAARQVHGAAALVVGEGPGPDAWEPGPGGEPPDGDALVAGRPGFALTVCTADCAPVALGSPEGVYGAVHVGWRGLVAGVLARAVAVARSLGATAVSAGLGPTIGPCCYAFSADDLDRVEAAVGHRVRGRTPEGGVSLDLPGAVAAQLVDVGAVLTDVVGQCTVCAPGYFSHRGSADVARQAVYVWREA